MPRKRSLAKAKPASVENSTVPTVIAPATMSELISPWFSGARSSACSRLSNKLAAGQQRRRCLRPAGVGVRGHDDRPVEREERDQVTAISTRR